MHMQGPRHLYVPAIGFLLGAVLMLTIYLGFLTSLEGWPYAVYQLGRDRVYVGPIVAAFGIQAALFAVLRFDLPSRVSSASMGGAAMGASGGTSTTAMVACCLHHGAGVLPLLGFDAATAFLARYQRPFMQIGLAMNLAGILVMLVMLQRARERGRACTEA